MNILINASNLSGGGGVQVADSICRYLKDYTAHRFTVVLSDALSLTHAAIETYPNVKVVRYNYPAGDWISFLTQRNRFLDDLVEKNAIESVLTVFGPMKWSPRCSHVCGFGLSHIVMPESPYFTRMGMRERIEWKVRIIIWELIFRRSSRIFVTENPLISERLQKKFMASRVETITNCYNQVFDNVEEQLECNLPDFQGTSILAIGTNYPHKNLSIAIDVARIIRKEKPNFNFRFVLTTEEKNFQKIDGDLKQYFVFLGKIGVAECPSLYRQCDVAFVPTLLECFTAAYPEAMRMELPIVTTDLVFARGLCGDAALYYDATSAQSAATQLMKVCEDFSQRESLVKIGKERLKIFDTSESRARKLIALCENCVRR